MRDTTIEIVETKNVVNGEQQLIKCSFHLSLNYALKVHFINMIYRKAISY